MGTVLVFITLLLLSMGVMHISRSTRHMSTGAGAVVMSVGIFSTFALMQLPFYRPIYARIAALELLAIWLILAYSYARSALAGQFKKTHAHDLMQQFTIGTWVAGSAVLAVLVSKTYGVHWLAYSLGIVTLALYIPYIYVIVHGYITLWKHPLRQRSHGAILLATVTTQSIIIMLGALFRRTFTAGEIIALTLFDVVFLLSGLVLVGLSVRHISTAQLATKWKNSNCIIHGAVSITGLTLTLSPNIDARILVTLWGIAIALLVYIEGVELVRAYHRIRTYGVRQGIFTYDVSQWSRNFTFGMFYAFSFALWSETQIPALHVIVMYGAYVVLAFLIVETVLALRSTIAR